MPNPLKRSWWPAELYTTVLMAPPPLTRYVGIGGTLFLTHRKILTSGWTTWISIYPPLLLLLNAFIRIIIIVRQFEKYLGLKDLTRTLLLEH